MPHIHSEPGHHDHTVSFFVVRTDLGEPRVLLHRHRKTGRLSMFGGHVELHETPWQAALHEITEESGYEHSQLQVLQPPQRLTRVYGVAVHPQPVLVHTGQYPQEVAHFHTDSMYALVASEAPAGEPEDGESTDFRLLTLSELQELPPEEIFQAWREIGIYILTEVYGAWQPEPLLSFATDEVLYDGT